MSKTKGGAGPGSQEGIDAAGVDNQEPIAGEVDPVKEAASIMRTPRKKAAVKNDAATPKDDTLDAGAAVKRAEAARTHRSEDLDAESAVICAILSSPLALESVIDLLDAVDFSSAAYQEIYQAAISLESSGKPVDQVTVSDFLARSKTLGRVGGPARISYLASLAGEISHVAEHAEIVAERARLRRLADVGRGIVITASAPDANSESALAYAESSVFSLGKPRAGSTLTEMPKAVDDLLADMNAHRGSPVIGVASGLSNLDALTGGFRGGNLVVVAARPGVGKSAWSLQVARHIAETTGKVVPVLSYEMNRNEIMLRLLSSVLHFDSKRLASYDIPEGMEGDLLAAADRIRNMTLLIDDTPSETIGGVRSAMRRLGRRSEVGAIVIDYLQLMGGDRSRRDENRVNEIAEISRGLKRLASELDVPVIALSQLNRKVDDRPNKRPLLSDLRDSGAVEQDANLVLFLFKEHAHNSAVSPDLVECIVAKNRGGPVGTVLLKMDGATASFADIGMAGGDTNFRNAFEANNRHSTFN